jgi:hypothetical protein
MKGSLPSLSISVLGITLGAFQKDEPQPYELQHCCVKNSKINYRQVSFYVRVTFLKRSCKSNTKFPVYFLGA